MTEKKKDGISPSFSLFWVSRYSYPAIHATRVIGSESKNASLAFIISTSLTTLISCRVATSTLLCLSIPIIPHQKITIFY